MNVVSYKIQGDVGILTIEQERLLDDASLQALQRQLLTQLDEAEEKKIVLNFQLVDFVSSAGLGMLIRIKKRCTDAGKSLRICGLDPMVYETIQITGLEQLFDINVDVAQAVAAFQADA